MNAFNPAGWNLPGFDDRSWLPAKVIPAPKGSILPFTAPPITAHEVFEPVKIVSPHPGEYTYIFLSELLCASPVYGGRGDGEESPVQTLRIRGFDGSCEIHLYMGNRQRDMARLHDRGSGKESHQTTLFATWAASMSVSPAAVPAGYPNPSNSR